MNYADANRLRAVLNSCGLKDANEKSADLMIIVACSVRQKPIQRIWGKIRNWTRPVSGRGKQKKKIWITGCILPDDKKKFINKVDRVFEIDEIGKIPKWLKLDNKLKIINNNGNVKLKNSSRLKFISSPSRDSNNNYLEICPENSTTHHSLPTTQYLLPIMTGCNNFCSYCAVPYCRGPEISRPIKNIINELKQAIKSKYKRILLLGQNVNSYKITQKSKLKNQNYNLKLKTKKSDFVELLIEIEKMKGDFNFNFMTSHPKDFSDDLIRFLAKSKKWERELHLPLQSGSDRILKLMNRKYTIKQYLNLIKKLKLKIKNLKISTDIIVGFPTETKKDFLATLKTLKTIKPAKVYVSQFSPRPGTNASKMKNDISANEKKRRWNIVNKAYNK